MSSLILTILLSMLGTAILEGSTETSDRAKAYYHFSLSRFHREGTAHERAVEELKKALRHDPESSELHSWLALSLAETNQLQAAIDACRESIKLDAENPEPHLLLGKIYLTFVQQGRVDVLENAISNFSNYLNLVPDDPDALFPLAGLYFSSRQWSKASKTYALLRSVRDNIPGVDLRHAQALANLSRTDEAIEILQESLTEDRELGQKLSLLGHLHNSLDHVDRAIEIYQHAREVILDDAHRSDVGFSLGTLLNRKGRFEEAIAVLSEVVEHSYDLQVRVELGKAYEGRRQYSVAVEKFQMALNENPNHLEANYYIASSLRNLGRRGKAIRHLEKLIVLTANEPARVHSRTRLRQFLAVLYQESHQHEKAINLFRTLSKEHPDNQQIKLGLVYTLKEAQLLRQALHLSRSLYQEAPDSTNVAITHARMLSASDQLKAGVKLLRKQLRKAKKGAGDWGEMEEFYVSTSQLYSEHNEHRKALHVIRDGLAENPDSERLTFHLGATLEQLGDIRSAEKQFKKVLDKTPDHAVVLNYLGYMLAERGTRLNEALEYIERALAQDPHNGAYRDSLGWVYFKLNKLDLAEKNLIQAFEVDDSDPTILEHLGDLYVKLGDKSKALTYYKKSVSWAEDHEESEKVRAKLIALEKRSPIKPPRHK